MTGRKGGDLVGGEGLVCIRGGQKWVVDKRNQTV